MRILRKLAENNNNREEEGENAQIHKETITGLISGGKGPDESGMNFHTRYIRYTNPEHIEVKEREQERE